jgi:PIN domain nuclease of toxin-antitoxin system
MGGRLVIVLDTHAWVWFTADDRALSDAALQAIHDADRVGVAAISVWELGMLCAKSRLKLHPTVREWVHAALRLDRVELLPLTAEAALLGSELDLHGDPADRLIVASALLARAPLVTRDSRVQESGLVATIS